jgi:hypothetical protein
LTYALRNELTVKTTNIICEPPALATLTISVIAFGALYGMSVYYNITGQLNYRKRNMHKNINCMHST